LNTQKRKIRDFAKDLFLQVDADGNKVNTWDSISKCILKKFKLEIHFTTIQKWSKAEDWNNTYEKIKMAGIESAKSELQVKENKLIDEKAQVIADIYKSNKSIQNLSKQTIISRLLGKQVTDKDGNEIKSDFGNTDLIRLLQHSEQTILTLHDKKTDPNEINVNTVKLTYKTMNDE
jgi:hypothetical protein